MHLQRKFLYQQKKKQKEMQTKAQKVVLKEIRFGPNTDEHDYDFSHEQNYYYNFGEPVEGEGEFQYSRSSVYEDRWLSITTLNSNGTWTEQEVTVLDAMEGAFEVMQTGECDSNWAKEHHDLWYEELQKEGLLTMQDEPSNNSSNKNVQTA